MISIIIPFYNEEKNLSALYTELTQAMRDTQKEYETIFVDDGSTYEGTKVVEELSKKDNH
ncbi:glycosyltransferase [Candidatus Roizmanbacteria bacterium]|nr:glycosyltransferase [Candidatus Roizmanbacteria bacterium]